MKVGPRMAALSRLLAAVTMAALANPSAARAQNAPAATIAARQHFFGLDNVDAATGAVRKDRVILSWQGVSNFAASFNGHVVLLNAWIARAWWAIVENYPGTTAPGWPNQHYVGSSPEELAALKPEAIFFGHGHGDHAGDTPVVVRANPGITVLGAAEHCNDLRAEVKDMQFKCISVFPVDAPLGAVFEVKNLLSGVQITAVKHPHSDRTTVSETNQPFSRQKEGACQAFVDYPGDRNEPRTWNAVASGSVSVMWQFRIGEFALVWQDTAGPINGYRRSRRSRQASPHGCPHCGDRSLRPQRDR